MRMKNTLIIILLLIVKLVSAQDITAEKRMKKGIAGTWMWRKTVCCNMGGGSLTLADPKKKEKTLIISKDSTIKIFNEDQLVFNGRYKIIGIAFLQNPL